MSSRKPPQTQSERIPAGLLRSKMLLEFKEDKTLSREEKANLPKGPKTDHFGRIFNISGTMVKSAQIVIKHGIPMVNTFVQNGSWKLNMARKVVLLDSKIQESFLSTAEKDAVSASNAWFEGLKTRAEAKVADCKEAEKEAAAEKERKVKLNLELLNSSLSTATDKSNRENQVRHHKAQRGETCRGNAEILQRTQECKGCRRQGRSQSEGASERQRGKEEPVCRKSEARRSVLCL